jgi:thiamine biosynthesis lipoprotein
MEQKKDNLRKKICLALVGASVAVLLTFFYQNYYVKQDPIAKSGFYFNTVIAIQLNDSGDESLIDDCFALADTYEHYFSRTLEGSDIYEINHANGDWVSVHDETLELIQAGISYGEMSDGVFDITIGALTELWNIPDNDGVIPPEDEIRAAAATVDYRQIQIQGNQVCLTNPDAKLDLGGIAKGYAADAMKAYLNEQGVTTGFINLGGNVLTLGEKADGEAYRIGIRQPFGEENEAITTVKVADKSVVTSGSYERYFEKDGRIYHHILDPSSGYPYDSGLNAVTIISDSSMEGDALSTICFALGKEKGMELIDSMPDIEAIFIDTENQIYPTYEITDELR